jgi:hypothetical protein
MTSTITKEHISQFITSIASEYCLDEDKLIIEWEKQLKLEKSKKSAGKGKGKGKVKKSSVNNEVLPGELTDDILNNSSLAELKEFCRNRKLKVSGAKALLIARLKGEEEDVPKKTETKTGAGKKKSTKVVSDVKAKKNEEKSTVLEQIKDKATSIQVRRNRRGNLTHAETGLVFQKIDGDLQVIGHEDENGTIQNLNKEDIQNCKKFKFNYVQLPTNLDSNKEKEDEEEEIISDEEEEEEEVEIEEEEVEEDEE